MAYKFKTVVFTEEEHEAKVSITYTGERNKLRVVYHEQTTNPSYQVTVMQHYLVCAKRKIN